MLLGQLGLGVAILELDIIPEILLLVTSQSYS